MPCIDANLAVEFFEGTLSEAAAKEVESHAESCSSCRILLAELARSPTMAQLSPTVPAAQIEHVVLERGDKVGRFVVLNRLGSGGMGVVFSAYDPKLDRKVALKLLRSSSSDSADAGEAQTRLMREAQAMAALSHPNVISVYDVGTFRDEVYIAMELVEGSTLTGWLRKWERTWPDVVDKFVQAARALAAAHAAGLVHRDFKPDNVLVGNDERVRVMDFGLARWSLTDATASQSDDQTPLVFVSELNRTLTRSGTILGTPRYMAPEQFLGADTDARSDQFSFCVALYEALYGEYPFEGGSAHKLAESASTRRLQPKKEQAPELPRPSSTVPQWLHDILLRGLDPDPHRRFPSMDVLLQKLAPLSRHTPRRQWKLAAAGLAAAVVVLGVYVWESRAHIERLEARVVEAESSRAEAAAEQLKAKTQLEAYRKREKQLVVALRRSRHNRRQLASQLRDVQEHVKELQVKLADVTEDKPAPKPSHKAKRRGHRGLSEDQVQAAVEPHMLSIKQCFAEWRERNKYVEIKMSLNFVISKSGGLHLLTVTGTTDKVLRECVTGVLHDVAFPASKLPTQVLYDLKTHGTNLRVELLAFAADPANTTP